MEISKQYLTYEEYKGLGGTIDQVSFNLLEFECRKKIDIRTQNRLINVTEIPQEVKICIFKMIDKSFSYDSKINDINSKMIKSENLRNEALRLIEATIEPEITNDVKHEH